MENRVIVIILLLTSISCVGRESADRKTNETAQKIQETAPVAEVTNWQKILDESVPHPFTKKENGSALELVVQNSEPFTETAFDTFLVNFSSAFFREPVPFDELSVTAGGAEQTFFKARISSADVRAHASGEISQPELIRRFQVEIVETLESLKSKARLARREQRLQDAAAIVERWLKMEPDSAVALSLAGNIFRNEKKYWDAIEIYKKLLGLIPNQVFVYHNLGYSYEKVGAYSDSISAYKKAVELDGQNPVIVGQLAQVCGKNGNIAEALEWSAKARALRETSDIWIIEGNILRSAKKYRGADEAYARAQKLTPQDYRILFNRLLVDLDAKRFSDARKKFAELKGKDPLLAEELKVVSLFDAE